MSEALLCLQELAVRHQEGRDAVSQPVRTHVGVIVLANEGLEPVAEAAAAQPLLVVGIRGEQPRPSGSPGASLARQVVRVSSHSRAVLAPTATCRDFAVLVVVTTSAEMPRSMRRTRPCKVTDVQRGQLAATGSGVSGQAQQQPDLLGNVQPTPLPRAGRRARQLRDIAGCRLEEPSDDDQRHVAARLGLARTTHAAAAGKPGDARRTPTRARP
ncbi:MAG TPA: hypothetical protein VFR07_01890 [Mycobacteriales bacterium]|jgi:hypothetical protein|nr:hypothetical protein [Mycobacteriales bacterium]